MLKFCCYFTEIITYMKKVNKANSCCNGEWLELNSFFKTLLSDFLWEITLCNNFNWHCLCVKEASRKWLLIKCSNFWNFKFSMLIKSLYSFKCTLSVLLSFAVNKEKHVTNILKKLFLPDSVSEETRRSLITGLGQV